MTSIRARRAGGERRAHDRFEAEIACKVRRASVLAFSPACTIDVSEGGALLRVRGGRAIEAGERLGVALPWRGDAVVRSGSLIAARVVRTEPSLDGGSIVAVRFEQTQADAERLRPAAAA